MSRSLFPQGRRAHSTAFPPIHPSLSLPAKWLSQSVSDTGESPPFLLLTLRILTPEMAKVQRRKPHPLYSDRVYDTMRSVPTPGGGAEDGEGERVRWEAACGVARSTVHCLTPLPGVKHLPDQTVISPCNSPLYLSTTTVPEFGHNPFEGHCLLTLPHLARCPLRCCPPCS